MDGLFNFQLLKQIGHVLIDEYYKKLTQMNVKVLNNIYGRYPLSSYEFNAIITASTNHRAQVTSSLLQTIENILIAFTKSFWIRFPCDSDSELKFNSFIGQINRIMENFTEDFINIQKDIQDDFNYLLLCVQFPLRYEDVSLAGV